MLDATDRMLLTLLDLHPTMPLAELAERVNLSERTVARRYQSLRSRDLIRIVGRTRPDFGDQIAWLVRARMVPTQTERLANALADHHRMRWVRSTHDGGELVYGLVSVDPATDGVLQRLPDLPGVLALTPYELLWTWPRHGEAPATPPAPLDALDQMIIAALGENGRTTNRELARRARVDETTIGRRRARLEHSGVLYYEADIPQNALGRSIDAMLWIDASPGHIEETGARLHQTPECRFVAVTTGPTNVVANVVAETTRALITFTDRYLNEHVNRVEMQILGREFKRLA